MGKSSGYFYVNVVHFVIFYIYFSYIFAATECIMLKLIENNCCARMHYC